MSKWQSVQYIIENHNISKGNIYAQIHTHKNDTWHKKDGNRLLIDEQYFIKKHNYFIDIRNKAHDCFYILSDGFSMSLSNIAEYISSKTDRKKDTWVAFISDKLFNAFNQQSIIYFNYPEMVFEFEKYAKEKVIDVYCAGYECEDFAVEMIQEVILERVA